MLKVNATDILIFPLVAFFIAVSFGSTKAEPYTAQCPASMNPTDLVQWRKYCFAYGEKTARVCENSSSGRYVFIRLNSNYDTGVKEIKIRREFDPKVNQVKVERPEYDRRCKESSRSFNLESHEIDTEVYENYQTGFSDGEDAKSKLKSLNTERRTGNWSNFGRCRTTSSPFARYLSSLGDLSDNPRQKWELFIGRGAGRRVQRPFPDESFFVVRVPYKNGKNENYCVRTKLIVSGEITSLSLVDFDTPVGGKRFMEGFQKTWKIEK